MDTRELGNLGEKLACEYLVKKGFKILGKNDRISFGEIDIVAKKRWRLFNNDTTIHFVEVKTIIRSDGFFPEDRVNQRKQQKLKNLVHIWLKKNKYPQSFPCQIDVIGITVNPETKKAEIRYFPNAIEDYHW